MRHEAYRRKVPEPLERRSRRGPPTVASCADEVVRRLGDRRRHCRSVDRIRAGSRPFGRSARDGSNARLPHDRSVGGDVPRKLRGAHHSSVDDGEPVVHGGAARRIRSTAVEAAPLDLDRTRARRRRHARHVRSGHRARSRYACAFGGRSRRDHQGRAARLGCRRPARTRSQRDRRSRAARRLRRRPPRGAAARSTRPPESPK